MYAEPQKPLRLPLQASAACIAEVANANIPFWAPLKWFFPPEWKVPWAAYSLIGYCSDPACVHSPITRTYSKLVKGEIAPDAEFVVGPDDLQETTAAKDFPECLALANSIPGRNERVRLVLLGPKGVIPKHIDPYHAPTWEQRTLVRFHIPMVLPKGCTFIAWGKGGQCYEICQDVGSVWYMDTGSPHMVVNASFEPRIHFVVDKFLNPELRELLASLK